MLADVMQRLVVMAAAAAGEGRLAQAIRSKLSAALSPSALNLINDSHKVLTGCLSQLGAAAWA
jgi:hypothetical protein